MIPNAMSVGAPGRTSLARFAAALALVVVAVGLAIAPASTWAVALVASLAWTGLALGGIVFVALHHVTGGRWAAAVLPVPRAMARGLPAAGVLAAAVVGLGAGSLYPWADATAVSADAVLAARAGWMRLPLVVVRVLATHGAWVLLARPLLACSRAAAAHDASREVRAAAARASAWFLLGFAPTFTVFTVDVLQSLDRHFASTIFPMYHFAGVLLGGVAATIVLASRAARFGTIQVRWGGTDTTHDLGKLLFAFAFFWGYLWYCQYMLVWYTNLPEETGHYAARHEGPWEPVAILNVVLQWALPFALLLPRAAKRHVSFLSRVAGVVLVGRFVELVLAVGPATSLGGGGAAVAFVVVAATGAATLPLLDSAVRQETSGASNHPGTGAHP